MVSTIRFTEVLPSESGIAQNPGITWGGAWGDFNGDGLPDLWLNNHWRGPSLYLNQGDGTFSDITAAGLLEYPTYLIDGHGTAWADFDNDGDQDLIQLVGSAVGTGISPEYSNQLLINRDGKLEDQASARGVDYPLARGRGTLLLDYNQDGLLDFINGAIPRNDINTAPARLFQQNDDGTFEDASAVTGWEPLNATNFLYTDLSGDGILDLVARVSGRIRVYDISKLPFQDVTSDVLPAATFGFHMASADFNGDLTPDLYIGRGVPGGLHSDLYQNRTNQFSARLVHAHGPGSTELGLEFNNSANVSFNLAFGRESGRLNRNQIFIGAAGSHPTGSSFTLSSTNPDVVGVYPHNPDVDTGVYIGYEPVLKRWQVLFSSGGKSSSLLTKISSDDSISGLDSIGFIANPSPADDTLFISTAQGLVDMSSSSGINNIPTAATSVVAGDFDNDMDVDLYIVTKRSAVNSPNILLENQGDGTFIPHLDAWGAVGTELGQGDFAIAADYNLNGFLDLLVANGSGSPDLFSNEGPYQLFRNEGNSNHWAQFDLQGKQSNRDGIGAQVFLQAGGITQLREQTGGIHGYVQNHKRLHFGLADNSIIEELKVHWPSGQVQRISNLPADRLYRIFEEGGSEGDRIVGSSFNDIISGGAGRDILVASGGDDHLAGGQGNDVYVFKADSPLGHDTLIEAEGAAGGIDTLHFAPTATRSISIDLSSTMTQVVNDNLKITLSSGMAFENVNGGAQGDLLIGNSLRNRINGGAGNDTLIGGAGGDLLTGGTGVNTFVYEQFSDSLLASQSRDRILDLKIGIDVIDGPNAVSASQLVQAGDVAAMNQTAIAALLNTGSFVANGAATFTWSGHTFLALNDSTAGFQSASDSIIQITGYSGNLSDLVII